MHPAKQEQRAGRATTSGSSASAGGPGPFGIASIATWNVNGMRAALRHGLADVLPALGADIVMLQEIRATPEQLPLPWSAAEQLAASGWHGVWHPSLRAGYSGVCVLSRFPVRAEPIEGNWPRAETEGIDPGAADPEGRLLVVRVPKDAASALAGFRIVCVYLPSGSSGDHRQAVKEAWMASFLPWAARLARSRVPTVLGGDLNIAHTERDIFYAKGNAKTSGFLPHERAWMGDLLGVGWCDLVRESSGDVAGPYSWWSNRGRARELDRGWRIDYLLANRAAVAGWRTARIDREASLGISDHAPVLASFGSG